jgi:hypothetical protein
MAAEYAVLTVPLGATGVVIFTSDEEDNDDWTTTV